MLDSGIDPAHSEFSGQIDPDGRNVIGGRTSTNITETVLDSGHGTMVSGIIAGRRNDAGMRGVAYDADILPLRIFETAAGPIDYVATPTETGSAYAYGTAQGVDVFNGSYGFIGLTNVAGILPELDAIQTALTAGSIAVFAAGNDGGSNPYFPALMPYLAPANDGSGLYTGRSGRDYSTTAAQLLAVVSVDQSGTISSFSNRCGVAAAWCLAAPGGAVYGPNVGGSYVTRSGTSFAAPHVTGAVAALLDYYPTLTPAQVVTRILTTATKTGIYANSAVYGQGLLNLSSATSFVATPMLALSAHSSGPLVPVTAAALQSASAFGDGLASSLNSRSLLAIDSFDGATIAMPASALVDTQARRSDFTRSLRHFGQPQQIKALAGLSGTELSLQTIRGYNGSADRTATLVTAPLTASSSLTLSLGGGAAPALGLTASGVVNAADQLTPDAFSAPYLSFAANGTAAGARTQLAERLELRAVSYTGKSEDEVEVRASGGAVELLAGNPQGNQLALQVGLLQEEQSWLGSGMAGGSATALGLNGSTTSYTGLSGQLEIGAGTHLLASGFIGQSTVDTSAHSWLQADEPVLSTAFTLGLLQEDVLQGGDKLGISFGQPLRVSAGTATLNLPHSVSAQGELSRSATRASLVPSGRELTAELFYRAELEKLGSLAASMRLRHQPDHDAAAPAEAQGLVRWQVRF